MTKEWEKDVAMKDDAGKMKSGGKNWFDKGENGPVQVAGNGDVYVWGWTDRGASFSKDERHKLRLFRSTKRRSIIPGSSTSSKASGWLLQRNSNWSSSRCTAIMAM